ncbi:MAG: PRC-barrel domain-containing protein [Alphaproteobacteria bacterium]
MLGIVFGILVFALPSVVVMSLALLFGAYCVIDGVLLIIAQLAGAIALTWWPGAYAMVFGVVMLILIVRLRRRHASHTGQCNRLTAFPSGWPRDRRTRPQMEVIMKKYVLGSAVVLIVASLAEPGPRPVQAQAVELVILDVAAVARGYRASKLTGSNVVNDRGERIGTLDDVILGREEPRALYGILQVGGFLGIGGHLVAVPFGNLHIAQDGKVTLPGASREQLRRLPDFVYPAS